MVVTFRTGLLYTRRQPLPSTHIGSSSATNKLVMNEIHGPDMARMRFDFMALFLKVNLPSSHQFLHSHFFVPR